MQQNYKDSAECIQSVCVEHHTLVLCVCLNCIPQAHFEQKGKYQPAMKKKKPAKKQKKITKQDKYCTGQALLPLFCVSTNCHQMYRSSQMP